MAEKMPPVNKMTKATGKSAVVAGSVAKETKTKAAAQARQAAKQKVPGMTRKESGMERAVREVFQEKGKFSPKDISKKQLKNTLSSTSRLGGGGGGGMGPGRMNMPKPRP